jgi:hypothetical protein
MKATIEKLEYFISEMKKLQVEHPKATIYYDWESNEIRITYPLPKDYEIFKTTSDKF